MEIKIELIKESYSLIKESYSYCVVVPYTENKFEVSLGWYGEKCRKMAILTVDICDFLKVRIVGGETFRKEIEAKLLNHANEHHEKAFPSAIKIAKREIFKYLNNENRFIQTLCKIYDDGHKAGANEVRRRLMDELTGNGF